jgi:hypothetical protein
MKKIALAFIAAVSLLAAGCGGGHSGSPGSTPPAQNGAEAFARCMRSNGIPGWPDPTSAGVFDKAKLRQLGLSVARVRAIEDGPCKNLVPTGGGSPDSPQQVRTRVADALSFARCMRSHGVARFPDPTAQGQLTIEMVQAQGIDVHSPSVLQAVQACLPASHGALTPEKVRQALAKAGG